jgi:hypothetical protein
MKSKEKKIRCSRKKVLLVVFLIFIGVLIWKGIRVTYTFPLSIEKNCGEIPYSESEQVMKAISLSYLVYGCETCAELTGTVKEILEQNSMGIISENFGIKRQEIGNPVSAYIDTEAFICEQVGEFRFLDSVRDEQRGFYGAAFCDDENKCIWITYAGSVTLRDALTCVELVLTPGLTKQEESAFGLYNRVINKTEVKDDSYNVILTGHSLGGSYATEVSLVSGCNAVLINGAAGIVVDKMNEILDGKLLREQISNHMTSPDNEHLSWMDLVQRMMFLGSYKTVNYHVYEENGLTEDTHSIFSFIR